MKIIIPTPYFREEGGGINSFICGFSKEAVKKGHSITIISSLNKGEKTFEKKKDYSLMRIPMLHSRFFRRPFEYFFFAEKAKNIIANIQKKAGFDFVLGISLNALPGIGHKMIYRSASGPIYRELEMWEKVSKANWLKMQFIKLDFFLQKILERKCVKNALGFLCQSKAIADEFKKEYELCDLPLHYPCTGIDLKKFGNKFHRKEIREKYSIKNEKVIMFAGGLSIPKGATIIEKALPIIFEKHASVKMLIVGSCSCKLSVAKQYEKHIIYSGQINRDEMPKYYSAADLFFYPSIYNEGFPNALLEAMAAGLPIVTSEILGIEEYLQHGKNALIVPKYSIELAAKAVISLLDSPKLMAALRKNARAEVSRYAWKKVAKDILEFAKRVSSQNLNTVIKTVY